MTAGVEWSRTDVQVSYAWNVASDQSVRLSHQALLDVVGQVLDQVSVLAGSLAPEIVAGGISCFFHSIAGLDPAGIRHTRSVVGRLDERRRSGRAAEPDRCRVGSSGQRGANPRELLAGTNASPPPGEPDRSAGRGFPTCSSNL